MHPLLVPAWAAAGAVARAVAALPLPVTGKLSGTFALRRGIRARYAAWGAAHRDRARPLLWMHAPSVGEGLQARIVLERARPRHPEWQVAYTHFSPSASAFARDIGADFADALPFDTTGDAEASLDALAPSALVFSKLDVWPVLVARAVRRGVPLGMISATLAPDSSRGGGLSRAALRDAYAALDAVGAVHEDDAERLVALGVRRDAIRVTGDTRYDQVWARAGSVDPESTVLRPLASWRPTLVAGSTWPADESVLFAAWPAVRARVPGARLVIAPHEPSRGHLAAVEEWARDAGLALVRLSAGQLASADVILVDRVGVLGQLYRLAGAAMVGGGFHAAGLHSVLEPAAFGAPVVCGPQDPHQRDAARLADAGALVRVPDALTLAAVLATWLGHPEERRVAGEAARETVRRHLGAAEASVALVEGLMGRG